jgi:uncharacterized repeat protein (TIGR01451 family)
MKIHVRTPIVVISSLALCTLAFVGISSTGSLASRSASSLIAPSITVGKSVAFPAGGDVDNDGKADPGDTLEYTITVNNTAAPGAGNDASGIVVSDALVPQLTLQGSSVVASPVTTTDSYTATGNIAIASTTSVLANDVDPLTGNSTGVAVTKVQGSGANVGIATNTTATGRSGVTGAVTLAANGTFTYEPPPGFIGNDTFTYNATKGTGPESATTTVTITISNMVWFISNNAGGLNRGTFSNPFTSIAAFNTANAASGNSPDPRNGDLISLRTGTGTYTETDGINLRAQQVLIGNAIQFNGVFSANANSISAYTTFAGAVGAAPNIVTTAGNGIDLSTDNTLRGVNVGNTPGFFKLNGGAVGSPIINTISLAGTGGAINVSTSGSFGSNVTFGTLESTSSPGANLNLVNVTGAITMSSAGSGFAGSALASSAINVSGGGVTFTYAGNVTKSVGAGALVSVSGGHNGTLTFNSGTLSSTSGTGLQFDNADGNYSFSGTTALNGGDAGVDILNGSSGTFNFAIGASITGPTGIAFRSNGSTPSVTYSGTITHNSGRVVEISYTSPSTGNCGSFTFSGNVTSNGAAATGVLIDRCSGGSIGFSSGLTLNTAANAAFTFTNVAATGAGVTLSGGNLNIDTTGGTGVNATNSTIGAGSLTISGANNSVLATTGRAVNIDGVTSNITLHDVSVTGGGTATGVFLKNTGAAGQFIVTGTGTTAASGGAFANIGGADAATANAAPTTGTGIYLESVANISLANLGFTGTFSNFGIRGENVNNFTLTDSTLTGVFGDNTARDEDSIRFGTGGISTGLTGTSVFQGNTIQGGRESNLSVAMYGANTLNLTIRDTAGGDQAVFNNTSTLSGANSDFVIETGGTSNLVLNINGVAFNGANANLIQVTSIGSATQNIGITGNQLHNTQATTLDGGAGVLITGSVTNSSITYNIDGNSFKGTRGASIFSMFNGNSGTVNGVVNNNTFGTANGVKDATQANYGSLFGGAFFGGIDSKFPGTGVINYGLRISSNSIRDPGSDGVIMLRSASQDTQGTARLEATISNNSIAEPGSNIAGGIYAQVAGSGSLPASSDSGKMGLNISNNSFNLTGATFADGVYIDNGNSLNGVAYLPGYAGPANPFNQVSTYLTGKGNTFTNASSSGTGGAAVNGSVSGSNFVLSVPIPNPGNDDLLDIFLKPMENSSTFGLLSRSPVSPATTNMGKDDWSDSKVEIGMMVDDAPFFDPNGSIDVDASFDNSANKNIVDPPGRFKGSRINGSSIVSFLSRLFELISPTVSATDVHEKLAGETVTVNGGGSGFSIPGGSSTVIKFRAVVNNGPFAAGLHNINNTANASNIASGGSINVTSTNVAIALDAAPDLSISSFSDGSTQTMPGGIVTYTINYANGNAINGQGATGVVLTQAVPANTVFQTAGSTAGWSCANKAPAGTSCTLNVGALNFNTNGSATFVVKVLDVLPASITTLSATATIADDGTNGAEFPGNTANNSATDINTQVLGVWIGNTSADWNVGSNWSNTTVPPSGFNIVNGTSGGANSPQVISQDVTIGNLVLNGKNVTIADGRTINANGNVTLGANSVLGGAGRTGILSLGTTSAITTSGGFVNCVLNKAFSGPGPIFTYPVGFGVSSPVDVTLTAGSGTLSVKAYTGPVPNTSSLDQTRMLQRYWSLVETGGLTANAVFHYAQTDVPVTSDETQYAIFRVVGGGAANRFNTDGVNYLVDPALNTFTVNGLQVFSDWTAGNPLVPTAANVRVAGRVLTAEGVPVYRARVTIVDQFGVAHTSLSNPFGNYFFDDIEPGQTYVVSVRHREYTFAIRTISVTDNIGNFDIIAEP